MQKYKTLPSTNECPGFDTKPSENEVLVQKLSGM